ncbi:ABC transporter ATP-binding protein [Clostridia bacterium]|nr:ABC transporter ATP-binding protein [Clostridia bacterium]
MINILSINKSFGDVKALNNFTCEVADGTVFGLVGSNGAGKSTLLRILAGVIETDNGVVEIDGLEIFDNPIVRGSCFFIADYPFFYNDSTVENMAKLYEKIYPNWSKEKYAYLCNLFPIDKKARVINMSKGMQRQAALILALSSKPKYLFMDEIFDGLDPVVRQLLKKLLMEEVAENKMTVIIASHNLRELEDVCDHVGLLHKGGILLEKEIDEMKLGIHKVQAAFLPAVGKEGFSDLNIVNFTQRGSLVNMVVRGNQEEIMRSLEKHNPVFAESLPLTLEEVFINEMEVAGYDINNITK